MKWCSCLNGLWKELLQNCSKNGKERKSRALSTHALWLGYSSIATDLLASSSA